MPERATVARVATSRGELVLIRDGADFEVVANGVFLMDTRDGRSERLLARAALAAHPAPRRVLVGGLGVGFTLAAVLADARVAEVTVVEVEPALVGWHRGALGERCRHAVDDPRVRVIVADVLDHLAGAGPGHDVICLDIDNGPDWTVTEANGRLYTDAGTQLLRDRLAPGGVLAVWSARPVPAYRDRLAARFTAVSVHEVPVARGAPDVVYVATDDASGG